MQLCAGAPGGPSTSKAAAAAGGAGAHASMCHFALTTKCINHERKCTHLLTTKSESTTRQHAHHNAHTTGAPGGPSTSNAATAAGGAGGAGSRAGTASTAGAPGGAGGSAGADKSAAAAPPADKTTAVLQAALLEAHKLWRACGMLDDAEQVCMVASV
ncbi:hypothetical protein DUNSADRAFT_14407 [Dunaliella salina]|uniref:Encoded protein n=1 Tax=Dunaliella salina TaxID=3046 RepID=A0ABQ7H9G6_DUNSA|nr:hypothetical protein DUNSADRAFT_14407 [Dunaliella salina]|eukprot:KAF5843491.1 hypothetical protein DUNSADRAFT_14407 [Dunaliella salina]